MLFIYTIKSCYKIKLIIIFFIISFISIKQCKLITGNCASYLNNSKLLVLPSLLPLPHHFSLEYTEQKVKISILFPHPNLNQK